MDKNIITFKQNYTPVKLYRTFFFLCAVFFAFVLTIITYGQEVLTGGDIMRIKTCTETRISPDGAWIAYSVRQIRDVNDKAGADYSELYLVSVKTGVIKPYVTGKVNVSLIRWSPDGLRIGFIMRRGENTMGQVWTIPLNGGEAVQLTNSASSISDFQWAPSGKYIVYIAQTPESPQEKNLKEKEFNFIFYEENIKSRNLYLQNLDIINEINDAEQLSPGLNIWDFRFSDDGNYIIYSASEKNLIDQRYMFRSIYSLDLKSRTVKMVMKSPWKLGTYSLSPDNLHLAYCAGLDSTDQAVSQLYVLTLPAGVVTNLTLPEFRGHVEWVAWLDNQNIVYQSAEGVWSTLRTVHLQGKNRQLLLNAEKSGINFSNTNFNATLKKFSMIGSTPQIPGDVFCWEVGKNMRRMTNINPWLEMKQLGVQSLVKYKARDGWDIEGILIQPVRYEQGTKYPLIVYVHGGPESHFSNSWLSNYENPGQVFAAQGYFVFYPNYRASTGYGIKFSMAGYHDPAGSEFDDIADGIDYLVRQGFVDAGRVGLAGGSYGGYAAAWFGTYYTKYVKAVHMFVGISDLISKRSTTDIPWEDLYVHMGKKLEDSWEFNLQRSPVYWAQQSQTAFLICGGTNDTRVHPGQSLELYRRLKMNHHPAVRYIQYPGEAHGNSKQTSKIDFLYRQIEWFNWYVKDARSIAGPMPPLDISQLYGLENTQ